MVIALMRTGGIGDVILSTVAITYIRKFAPECKIIWLGREPSNDLIRTFFPDIDVFEISPKNSYKQNWSIIKNATQRLDAIIDLQHSARTWILGRLSASYFKCAYTSWNKYSLERSFLVFQSKLRGRAGKWDWFPQNLPNRYCAMGNCTVRALKKIDIRTNFDQDMTPGLISNDHHEKSEIIAIGLGAAFLTKALPLKWVEYIISVVVKSTRVKYIYLLGDSNQKNQAEWLLKEFKEKIEIHNLCGKTSLPEAAQILSQSRFAVVNDSGLGHLSEAVGTPVLAFFGPTHEKFGYRPYLEKSKVLSVSIGCRPCHKNGNTNCRYGDHACSERLDIADINRLIAEICND
jgi:ADP-heptose:LPS heptosyltransferase